MHDIAVFELRIFGSELLFYRFSIKHIQSISGPDPKIPFFIRAHIHYAQIGKTMTCIKVPEGDVTLGNSLQAPGGCDEEYDYGFYHVTAA
jgi:hypothetical protein